MILSHNYVIIITVYYIILLPGAPADQDDAVLSDPEFKALFYKAIPGVWRDKFEDLEILNGSNLGEIKTFVERQDLKFNQNQSKKRDNSNGKESGCSNGCGSGCGRGGHNVQDGGRGRGCCRNNNNNSGGGELKASDTCPLPHHSGHTWAEYFQNAVNANNRRNNGGGVGGGNNNCNNNHNNNNGGNGGNVHVNEDTNQGKDNNSNNDNSSRSSNKL